MDLPQGRSATTLITSIVELARTLGLGVVAEGVETEEQRQALADLDCAQAQGYLFARPEPADRCGAHLPSPPPRVPAQAGAPAVERKPCRTPPPADARPPCAPREPTRPWAVVQGTVCSCNRMLERPRSRSPG